jgi:hypothetical protein
MIDLPIARATLSFRVSGHCRASLLPPALTPLADWLLAVLHVRLNARIPVLRRILLP